MQLRFGCVAVMDPERIVEISAEDVVPLPEDDFSLTLDAEGWRFITWEGAAKLEPILRPGIRPALHVYQAAVVQGCMRVLQPSLVVLFKDGTSKEAMQLCFSRHRVLGFPLRFHEQLCQVRPMMPPAGAFDVLDLRSRIQLDVDVERVDLVLLERIGPRS